MGREVGKHEIDWGVMEDLLKEKGTSKRNFSRMLGFNDNWFTNARTKNHKITERQLEQISLILGCEKEKILIAEKKKDVVSIEPSQFEIDVLKELKEIKNMVLSMQTAITEFCTEQEERDKKEKPELFSELEIAQKVLSKTLENRQGVKYDEYMTAAQDAGVKNTKIADVAIYKCGCGKKTTGYGNNKTTWIFRNDATTKPLA